MKKIISIFAIALASVSLLSSCNDDLTIYPKDSMVAGSYFTSVSNLKTWCNYYYQMYSVWLNDEVTDNVTMHDATSDRYKLITKDWDANQASSWSWSAIRSCNYLLSNADPSTINGNETDINHYLAVARLTRAYLYFSKVKTYSDVPWYEEVLDLASEGLYKTQDSREYVMDKIKEDLDYAIANLQSGLDKRLFQKDIALAFATRVALYEGTFRKYHSELGLTSSANTWLQAAADYAKQLIDGGAYSIQSDYSAIFRSANLGSSVANSEVIMYKEYDTYSVYHYAYMQSATADFMREYLMLDGSRFTDQEGYETSTMFEFYKNRDKRLAQTFWTPGFTRPGDTVGLVNASGYYRTCKYMHHDNASNFGKNDNDLAMFRYAEILLSYAEAKAELGSLTQADIDLSINKLRTIHGGLPEAKLSDWTSDIDPVEKARYSNVSGAQAGAIYEIRRERRIELFGEYDARWDDLNRWSVLEILNDPTKQYGAYIPGFGPEDGLFDTNLDGTPDALYLLKDADAQTEAVSKIKDDYPSISITILESANASVTGENSGYVYYPSVAPQVEVPKDYYWPLSQKDILANPNLVQNKYWE